MNNKLVSKSLPWHQTPSIYDHVSKYVLPGKDHLAEGGDTLPDADRLVTRYKLGMSPGTLDGCFSHLREGEEKEKAVLESWNLIKQFCDDPSSIHQLKLYNWILELQVLDFIDPLLNLICKRSTETPVPELYRLAKSLATKSIDREPVKLGIAILGLISQDDDFKLFMTIGRHEEFTLYAAVALSNRAPNRDEVLWQLAQSVHAWGRIQTVRILDGTTHPQIKDWILRKGYKNSVMDEYLVYIAATTGELKKIIDVESIDDELLRCTGEIISNLIFCAAADGMEEYEDGPKVVELYLNHLAPRVSRVAEFIYVRSIHHWLTDDNEIDWQAMASQGWTPELKTTLINKCSTIMQQPVWHQIVEDNLQSEDRLTQHYAKLVAEHLS